jgi:hypothetical protein
LQLSLILLLLLYTRSCWLGLDSLLVETSFQNCLLSSQQRVSHHTLEEADTYYDSLRGTTLSLFDNLPNHPSYRII